jgi:hypothetical protein
MVKKDLAVCLTSACVNCTRDGKNLEDEIMGKMDRQNK